MSKKLAAVADQNLLAKEPPSIQNGLFRKGIFLKMHRALISLAYSLLPAAVLAQSDGLPPPVKLAQATFREYLELLALPNDAVVPADVEKNAQWLERAFTKRGFSTRLLSNQGKPMVFAEWPKKRPGAKTVLFYMHMDGQPVVPSEWSQKSPWEPVVKQRNTAGKWEIVETQRLFAEPLDSELRVFARAASDDKGPILMFLAAYDGLKSAGLDPLVNVKVILDSEEEKGSPSIPAVVTANRQLLATDAIVILDGPRHASERPTLVFGNRGDTSVTLVVYGPRAPLHSGHYGNYVPNPAFGLARLLATMKGDDGRVTIPGYYDRVKLSDAELKILAATPDDEPAILRRVGIAKAESVGGSLQQALQYPSLNVRGMAAASVGQKASNIVPHQATAELDLRTTPESPPDFLFGLLKAHIEKQGYHLVKGDPTDDDRARYPKLASLTMGKGGRAVRTPLDSPLGQWAYGVLKQSPDGKEPVRIRMMGGSVPTDSLVEILGAPFVIVPLVNGDNNQHTFDENMRVGHYVEGVRTLLSFMRTPY
jgi:acetylornithine deacetylase/succinyl-diaminopimelate desuccinylase-like protein